MTLSATAERRASEATRYRWFPNVDPYANYSNVLTQLDSEDLGKFEYLILLSDSDTRHFHRNRWIEW